MRITSVLRELLPALLALALATALVTGTLLLIGGITYVWLYITGAWIAITFAMPPLAIIVAAITVPLLSIDVDAIRRVRQTGGLPPGAIRISSTDALRLWALAHEVAHALRTPGPTHLWLTRYANASAHESRRFLRRRRRIRHLCIGVPLLLALTTEQLRAVLCHELAHYARRHAAFSTMVYRGSAVLRYVLAELDRVALPVSDVITIDKMLRASARLQRAILSRYANTYDLVTLAVRRRHEYAADRLAAATVGAATIAEALCAAHGATGRGQPPQPHRGPYWDSHPALEKRLAALGYPAATSRAGADPPAFDALVGDSKVLLQAHQMGFPHEPTGDHGPSHLDEEQYESVDGTPVFVQAYRIVTRNPAATLFVVWYLATIVERIFAMVGVLSGVQSTVLTAIFTAIFVALILVAVTAPLEAYRYDPGRPRRIRRWLNPATALVITIYALASLTTITFEDPAGLLVAGGLLAVGAPFYNPRAIMSRNRVIWTIVLLAAAAQLSVAS